MKKDQVPLVRIHAIKTVKTLISTQFDKIKQLSDFDSLIDSYTNDLLMDEDDEVRYYVPEVLKELKTKFGYDYIFEKFGNQFQLILHDPHYKVKLFGVDFILEAAENSDREIYEKSFKKFVEKFLSDPVFQIRKSAYKFLPKFVISFSTEWMKTKLLPFLMDQFFKNDDYTRIQVYFWSVSELSQYLDEGSFLRYLYIPSMRILSDLKKSGLYNVAFVVLDILLLNLDKIKPFLIQLEVKQILNELSKNKTMAKYIEPFLIRVH